MPRDLPIGGHVPTARHVEALSRATNPTRTEKRLFSIPAGTGSGEVVIKAGRIDGNLSSCGYARGLLTAQDPDGYQLVPEPRETLDSGEHHP
jgi:hypothetical protein